MKPVKCSGAPRTAIPSHQRASLPDMNASFVLARAVFFGACVGAVTACSYRHLESVEDPSCAVDDRELEACGGEPFGAWRLTEIERHASTHCDAGLLSSEITELLIQFESSGRGQWLEEGADDTELSRAFDWTRTDATLVIEGVAYDYCIDDDELRLSDPRGATFTLERVYVRETEIPACEEREANECEAGERPSEGCQRGVCTGSAFCPDIASESSCTNTEGCAWDEDRCQGEPVASCSLWHYGRMAGCELTDREPSCAGASRQCRELPISECDGACAIQPGCIGATIVCSAIGPSGSCGAIAGCSIDGRECTGVTECSEQTSAAQCVDAARATTSGCQWVDAICQGEPNPPCEELSLTRCEAVPGCYLEFPEDPTVD